MTMDNIYINTVNRSQSDEICVFLHLSPCAECDSNRRTHARTAPRCFDFKASPNAQSRESLSMKIQRTALSREVPVQKKVLSEPEHFENYVEHTSR